VPGWIHIRVLALSVFLVTPASAAAQDPGSAAVGPVRLEWAVQEMRPGAARVVGYLYNLNLQDAANVWIRIDRLRDDGTAARTYRRRLIGDVRSRGRMAFDVAVPEPAATYRVTVESLDWVGECR
jgi:hypothetical protein